MSAKVIYRENLKNISKLATQLTANMYNNKKLNVLYNTLNKFVDFSKAINCVNRDDQAGYDMAVFILSDYVSEIGDYLRRGDYRPTMRRLKESLKLIM